MTTTPEPKKEMVAAIWVDDKLERQKYSEILTKVISQQKTEDASFTLVVKSSWGTGKTFFVEKWMQTLQQKGSFCVYFSAWEAEIHKNTGIYFLQAFNEAIEKGSRLANFSKNLNLAAADVVPIVVTLMILAAIAPDSLSAFLASIPFLGASAKQVTAYCRNKGWKLEDLKQSGEPIKDSREHLTKLVSEIAKSSKDEKIYIFIDELDRCKPDFAIKVLEEIKHFFSVPNVVFVLSVDLDQLEGSIKHVYGKHIDCEGYLMRFVNLFYTLPPITHELFADHLFNQLPVTEENKFLIAPDLHAKKTFVDLFSACSGAFKASLRDQIMIKNRLELMLSAGKVFLYPTVYLLFVQLRYPIIWQRALKNNLSSVSPKALHRTLETYQKELNNDFARETTTALYQTEVILFNLEVSEPVESLLPELIRLLGANGQEERASILNEKDKECSAKRNSLEARYWGCVYNCQRDFFNQLDLINLYSDGFA